MLIKVFGIWLMAVNINHLEPHTSFKGDSCYIVMNAKSKFRYVINTNLTCDKAAEEINKQLRGE